MKERPALEAALENAEAIVDAFSDDEVLKEIPVVGTLFKLGKAVDSIRERLFVARVQAFLEGTGRGPDVVQKWRKRLSEQEDEAQKVGETLLLVVERSEDLRKSELFGLLFLAFLDGVVTAVELRRIIRAADLAFTDDLDAFLRSFTAPEEILRARSEGDFPFVATLSSSGITRFAVVNLGRDGEQHFEGTMLAVTLSKAFRHALIQRQRQNAQRAGGN